LHARLQFFTPPSSLMRYGIDAKLFDWSDEITADCPREQRET